MATPKDFLFDEEGRRALKEGLDQLARAVKVTLGPKGKSVGVQTANAAPVMTRDGYRVARAVDLKDPYANLGVSLGKEVGCTIKEKIGDGTTTGILLLQALVSHGLRCVAAGASPLLVAKGMEKAGAKVLDAVDRISSAVDHPDLIEYLATVSAAGDHKIGQTVFQALEHVGPAGLVTIEEAKKRETEIEHVQGICLESGYASSYFCTNAHELIADLQDVDCFLTDQKITSIQDILSILQYSASAGKSLLIIAQDIEADALSTLVMNKLRGMLKVCAIKAPGCVDQRKGVLEDVAVVTGAQVVARDKGMALRSADPAVLGYARSVQVSKEKTIIADSRGKKKAIGRRIAELRRQLANTSDTLEQRHLEERVGKLSGGAAVIRVGGVTESEVKQKKEQFKQSLQVTKAAQKSGYVVGGGIALLKASQSVVATPLTGDEKIGAQIVVKACQAPFLALVENSSYDQAICLTQVLNGGANIGFNVVSEKVEDLILAHVIDPTSVAKGCLIHALSGAKIALTSNVLIVDRG